MTDNELIKALECCNNNNCKECPYGKYNITGWCCMPKLRKDTLDLINRQKAEIGKLEKIVEAADGLIEAQKAEIENLTKVAEQQQSVAMDRYFEIERLKAEIERLQTEIKLLTENGVTAKYPHCVLCGNGAIFTKSLEEYDKLIADIKAEAVKEFAERLKSELFTGVNVDSAYDIIDNILKEMVGEQRKEDEGK